MNVLHILDICYCKNLQLVAKIKIHQRCSIDWDWLCLYVLGLNYLFVSDAQKQNVFETIMKEQGLILCFNL